MKRFLFVLLFSLLIPIQNSSAVSPSLEETIDFLINGDDDSSWIGFRSKLNWSIDDKCILKKRGRDQFTDQVITLVTDLNKVIVETIKPSFKGKGFTSKCKGDCIKFEPSGSTGDSWSKWNELTWSERNELTWKRNRKALSHLYSNFCTGAKTAF